MSMKPRTVRPYNSQHNAGQPQQAFSSLEQMLRQYHIEPSAAASSDSFIRKAVPNISELNPDHTGIEDFLMKVEPWRSARYLVAELRHAESVNPILRVLARYWASEHTVKPLIGALDDNNPTASAAAKSALIGYGGAALDFIKTQGLHTPLHLRQLTEVLAAIRSGQSGGVR